tara:strand:+ start:411 stop:632 length:222 start_codon:yes stop_codon:yes gene_type:complete
MLSDDDMGLIQQDADLFYKTKEWLNQEVKENKEILDCPWPDNLDRGRGPRYREGRVECMEGLLRKIDEWENKE